MVTVMNTSSDQHKVRSDDGQLELEFDHPRLRVVGTPRMMKILGEESSDQ